MYEFLVTYECGTKENRDAFHAALVAEKLGETCEAEDGCLRYEYFFPAKAEDKLFLLEMWESREAQKVHTTQPHFARIGEIKKAFGATASIRILKAEEI